jgi:hypothetical protein
LLSRLGAHCGHDHILLAFIRCYSNNGFISSLTWYQACDAGTCKVYLRRHFSFCYIFSTTTTSYHSRRQHIRESAMASDSSVATQTSTTFDERSTMTVDRGDIARCVFPSPHKTLCADDHFSVHYLILGPSHSTSAEAPSPFTTCQKVCSQVLHLSS